MPRSRGRWLVATSLVTVGIAALAIAAFSRPLRVRWLEHELAGNDRERWQTAAEDIVQRGTEADLERLVDFLLREGESERALAIRQAITSQPRTLGAVLRRAAQAESDEARGDLLDLVITVALRRVGDEEEVIVHERGEVYFYSPGFRTEPPPRRPAPRGAAFAWADWLARHGILDAPPDLGARPPAANSSPNLGLELAVELEIASVTTGSAAERARLAPGDRIVGLEGGELVDERSLSLAVEAARSRRADQIGLLARGARGGPAGRVLVDVSSRALGFTLRSRLVVTAAYPELPAREAGVLRGDMILAVDGEPVGSREAFAIRTAHKQRVKLLIARRGSQKTLVIELGP